MDSCQLIRKETKMEIVNFNQSITLTCSSA
jgi:hypothetical protein